VTFAGTGQLLRLVLRLERRAFPIWIAVFTLTPPMVAAAFESLYPDPASLEQAAQAVGGNAAFTALLGEVYAATVGGLTAWRIGTVAALFAGIFSALTVIRHTRVEEETGRYELFGSMPIGRHAPLAAAVLATLGANLAFAIGATVGLLAAGQPAEGSVALGLAFGLTGWAFTGVGLLAAQVTDSSRAARMIASSVLGAAFLLRMLGDSADGFGWASWVSPLGWGGQLKAFADEAWWVVVLPIGLALVTLALAARVAMRRDIGAGLLRTRAGVAEAAGSFDSPWALAWRLQRGVLLAWAIGVAVFGTVMGGVAPGVVDLGGGSEQFREILERMGGTEVLTDAFIAGVVGMFGMGVTAYAILAILRLRTEEVELRAEPVLATGVTRTQWLLSHAAFAVGGTAIIMVVFGISAGVTFGVIEGDVPTQVARVLSAALVQLPATLTLAGLAVALVGWLPAHVGWSWGALAAAFLVSFLGAILGLDQVFLDLSPFTHTPQLPVAEFTVLPVALLSAVAVGLGVAGWFGLLQRDIA
jgi:ABC-2 type transport system permease protein